MTDTIPAGSDIEEARAAFRALRHALDALARGDHHDSARAAEYCALVAKSGWPEFHAHAETFASDKVSSDMLRVWIAPRVLRELDTVERLHAIPAARGRLAYAGFLDAIGASRDRLVGGDAIAADALIAAGFDAPISGVTAEAWREATRSRRGTRYALGALAIAAAVEASSRRVAELVAAAGVALVLDDSPIAWDSPLTLRRDLQPQRDRLAQTAARPLSSFLREAIQHVLGWLDGGDLAPQAVLVGLRRVVDPWILHGRAGRAGRPAEPATATTPDEALSSPRHAANAAYAEGLRRITQTPPAAAPSMVREPAQSGPSAPPGVVSGGLSVLAKQEAAIARQRADLLAQRPEALDHSERERQRAGLPPIGVVVEHIELPVAERAPNAPPPPATAPGGPVATPVGSVVVTPAALPGAGSGAAADRVAGRSCKDALKDLIAAARAAAGDDGFDRLVDMSLAELAAKVGVTEKSTVSRALEGAEDPDLCTFASCWFAKHGRAARASNARARSNVRSPKSFLEDRQ